MSNVCLIDYQLVFNVCCINNQQMLDVCQYNNYSKLSQGSSDNPDGGLHWRCGRVRLQVSGSFVLSSRLCLMLHAIYTSVYPIIAGYFCSMNVLLTEMTMILCYTRKVSCDSKVVTGMQTWHMHTN